MKALAELGLSDNTKNSSNRTQQIIPPYETFLADTETQAQHTLKGFNVRLGNNEQRGYNGLLSHSQTQPPQTSKNAGTKSIFIIQ